MTKKAPIKRITPVILCGGEGARLAPLSSPERPKYLLKGWSARSILQETILRVSNDALFNEPLLITSNRTEALVRADAAKVAGARFTLMAEPVARSTCPPLIAAALLASRNKANPLLLALPADHYIESLEIFIEILKVAALETVVGEVSLFGVLPKRAETGFGYIERGETGREGTSFRVRAFHEKPSLNVAKEYLSSGRYFINSGIALFSASTLLDYAESYLPELLGHVRTALSHDSKPILRPAYAACKGVSFDNAVLEGAIDKRCFELKTGWSDLGTMESLREAAMSYPSEVGSLFNAIKEGLPLNHFMT